MVSCARFVPIVQSRIRHNEAACTNKKGRKLFKIPFPSSSTPLLLKTFKQEQRLRPDIEGSHACIAKEKVKSYRKKQEKKLSIKQQVVLAAQLHNFGAQRRRGRALTERSPSGKTYGPGHLWRDEKCFISLDFGRGPHSSPASRGCLFILPVGASGAGSTGGPCIKGRDQKTREPLQKKYSTARMVTKGEFAVTQTHCVGRKKASVV
ncbi:hypothetical protein RRG08_029955 [Elysia crispata]|uniref:Uncharacterized protein n=1 Tax=Elysia crispata TaxID=231223 RepID=A0AAE0ZJ50_9GAST|nr:hypothetical protein RRG08_029955 [Elysia crispata]